MQVIRICTLPEAAAMLVSLIIVFREALEAGLIVGIVLAATEGVPGVAAGSPAASPRGSPAPGLVAAFAAALSDAFEGAGQEIFTAGILCFAVVMLSWHILWMSHHARAMAAELREVGQAVRLGQRSLAALAAVVAVAVMREGAEVVLFLYGIVAGSQTSALSLATGGRPGWRWPSPCPGCCTAAWSPSRCIVCSASPTG